MGSKATISKQRGQRSDGTNPSGERNQTRKGTSDNTGRNDEVLGGTSERVKNTQTPLQIDFKLELLDRS